MHEVVYISDYTEDNNITGVTITNHQVVAFIKRDGHLSKFSFEKLEEKEDIVIIKKLMDKLIF